MRETMIEFFVPGIPKPGGSKRAVPNWKTGKVNVFDDCNGNLAWRNDVQSQYIRNGRKNFGKSVIVLGLYFFFQRPKGHFGTGRNSSSLRKGAPVYHLQKPDITKLVRAVEDALTGVAWTDDCQVFKQMAQKSWCDDDHRIPGVFIKIHGFIDDDAD